MKKIFVFILFSFMLISFLSQPLEAIPAFARKHNLKCTNCHSAFPKLNATGRAFKVRGYRLEEEVKGEVKRNQEVSKKVVLEKKFPLSGLIKGYLYDKKKGSDQKTRPFHELELMIGGNVYKNISVWAEIEAEDENDFAVGVEMGVVGWHFSPYLNIITGYAPYFWSDPYDTLADWGRRMTRSHKAPLNERHDSGVRLRSSTQFMSFYGRAGGFLYSAGYHRDLGDPEGEGGEDFSVRAAYEFTPEFGETAANIAVGGFGVFGKQGEDETGFSRVGFDLQAEIGDSLNLLFAFLNYKDDLAGGGETTNTAWYGELFWVFYDKEFSPGLVPLIRVENYTRNDGALSFTDLSANLSYYLSENVRLSLEYWTNLSVPDGAAKNNRITAYFTLIF